MLRSRDLFGAERRPELRMAAPWAGQSSGIARSRARAARRPCGEVVGHRPQAANYLDSREQEKVMSRFVFSIVPLNRGKEAICTRVYDVSPVGHMRCTGFFIYSSLGVGIHHLLGGFGDVDHLLCFPLPFRLRLEDVDHLLRIGRFQRTWIIYSGYHNYPLLSDISQGQPGGSTKGSALEQFYAAHSIVGEHRGA